MRFTKLLLSIFLSSAALVAAADVDTVVGLLGGLNNDLKTLDTDVKNLPAGITGISQALQVSVDTVQVDNDIIGLTAAVNKAAKFSADDSQRLIKSIDTVTATANQTLTDTIAKNGTFAGLAPIVLASLYALKADQGDLGFAFAFKLDQSAINQGVTDLTALQNGFQAAIVAYGGCE